MNVGTWLQAEHRLHVQTGYEALTAAVGLALLVALAAADASAAALAAAASCGPALLLAGLMQRELGRLSLARPGGPGSVAAPCCARRRRWPARWCSCRSTRGSGSCSSTRGPAAPRWPTSASPSCSSSRRSWWPGSSAPRSCPCSPCAPPALSAGEDALAADLLVAMTLAAHGHGAGPGRLRRPAGGAAGRRRVRRRGEDPAPARARLRRGLRELLRGLPVRGPAARAPVPVVQPSRARRERGAWA